VANVTGPDREAALEQYRRRAGVYDLELALFEPLRRRAVAALQLRSGETVLDVGCGTGLSLPLLCRGVGPGGHVIGIEQSPPMLEQARQRARQTPGAAVSLINAPVESARLRRRADAALFHFTHDILRRPEAVANVLRHLKPGARVVATGLKWASGVAWPVNLLVWPAARRSVTTLQGLDCPWSVLQHLVGRLEIEELLFGAVYLARGRVDRAADDRPDRSSPR
jgi:SAM-dependent methyltransferase